MVNKSLKKNKINISSTGVRYKLSIILSVVLFFRVISYVLILCFIAAYAQSMSPVLWCHLESSTAEQYMEKIARGLTCAHCDSVLTYF